MQGDSPQSRANERRIALSRFRIGTSTLVITDKRLLDWREPQVEWLGGTTERSVDELHARRLGALLTQSRVPVAFSPAFLSRHIGELSDGTLARFERLFERLNATLVD